MMPRFLHVQVVEDGEIIYVMEFSSDTPFKEVYMRTVEVQNYLWDWYVLASKERYNLEKPGETG